MDTLQQRILEIAQQIPEYVGYQAKERRRDADKLVRRQLALKYEEQRTRLQRVSRAAPLEYIVNLENLDQKFQRLIARLHTAPGGYAGWFDAAQIGDSDLDQLMEFDAALTDGVAKVKTALDTVAAAVKAKTGVEDAVDACAVLLDDLNSQFDGREQFLALGKKPSLTMPTPPTSALAALNAKPNAPAEFVAFGNLKLNDAVTFAGKDYIIAGKITYTAPAGVFWALLMQDGGETRWLRVGPDNEIAVCQEIKAMPTAPQSETLNVEGQVFARRDSGTANVTVEGAGGTKRGTANYARYTGAAGARLWIEDYGTETRSVQGETAAPDEFKIYKR